MLALCFALIGLALLISAPTVAWLIGVGRRGGRMDRPGLESHKQHTAAVPNLGGIGIFLAIALPLVAALAAGWFIPADRWAGPLEPVAVHIDGLRRQTPAALAVLGAMAVLHVMGLVDDRKPLGANVKLAVQLLVAITLAWGFDMRVLELLDEALPGALGKVLSITASVLWIVVITNAMNMLDNMDGLSAGVGGVIASLYLAATLIGQQWFVAALAALLVGALIGFLIFNFHPAKVFMGDGGSLVIGLLLAVISIRTTYFNANDPLHPGAWYGVLMPLIIMAVPLYDFTSVCLIRISQGRSPFVGDRNHFSHRLVRRGLSVRAAVVLIWLCTLATGLSGVMLASLNGWQAAIAGAQSAAVIVVLALLERAGPEEDGRDA
jgi:UDP-GlcNAc:undecaprenyl-phosphate GlcNAc-1-phosphate transferase